MDREEMKNHIKVLQLKSGLSEEDFPRELSTSIQTKRNEMVKNIAIKPSPQSTSTKVELMVRNQTSKESRLSHSTTSSTKNVPKILCYLQTLFYLQ